MKVPDFKDPAVTKFLNDFQKEIERDKRAYLSSGTANHSVLLQAPNNKIYEVTVTNAGALAVTLIQG